MTLRLYKLVHMLIYYRRYGKGRPWKLVAERDKEHICSLLTSTLERICYKIYNHISVLTLNAKMPINYSEVAVSGRTMKHLTAKHGVVPNTPTQCTSLAQDWKTIFVKNIQTMFPKANLKASSTLVRHPLLIFARSVPSASQLQTWKD